MKKLLKTILTIMLTFTIFTTSYAATYTESINADGLTTKIPSSISYKDFIRLEEVATAANEKQVKVVNAAKFNNNETIWVARLKFGTGDATECADFLLTTLPYTKDTKSNKVISLPFNSLTDGIALYGAKWYYYGIIDNKDHNICGYVVAQRIKRWSKWNDLDYSGKTKAGVDVIGSYNEECNEEFIKLHTEILG